mmetsp:Transcript_98694/g.313142  ORF Transcript_98694/g.313142 Transcript_98694/m.313142 type:complete len:214 (+) Transcript_98694:456-1097(+)
MWRSRPCFSTAWSAARACRRCQRSTCPESAAGSPAQARRPGRPLWRHWQQQPRLRRWVWYRGGWGRPWPWRIRTCARVRGSSASKRLRHSGSSQPAPAARVGLSSCSCPTSSGRLSHGCAAFWAAAPAARRAWQRRSPASARSWRPAQRTSRCGHTTCRSALPHFWQSWLRGRARVLGPWRPRSLPARPCGGPLRPAAATGRRCRSASRCSAS